MDDLELLDLARHASERAYAPYSRLRVGAAVLAADGRVFAAANVENASYGLTLCAERAALACAVAGGVEPGGVTALAATAAPCGACRQWLVEFGVGRIAYPRPDGSVVTVTPVELLPDAFGPAR